MRKPEVLNQTKASGVYGYHTYSNSPHCIELGPTGICGILLVQSEILESQAFRLET